MKILTNKESVCDECGTYKKCTHIESTYTLIQLCKECIIPMIDDLERIKDYVNEDEEDIPLSSGSCEVISSQELSNLSYHKNIEDDDNEFDNIFD